MKNELIKKIIDKNGIRHENMISIEKCNELIKAINQCSKEDNSLTLSIETRNNIIDKIANMMICIEHLKVMYGLKDDEVDSAKIYKELTSLNIGDY